MQLKVRTATTIINTSFSNDIVSFGNRNFNISNIPALAMFDIDELVQIGLLEKDNSSNVPSCDRS